MSTEIINDEIKIHINKEFSGMNEMQKKAIFNTNGPLLILAGAGSGKTTVLVNRILYLVKYCTVAPWNILAITFTNKAANELKDRLSAKIPEGADDIWAGTFHSICVRILRRYGDRIGYGSNFTIYDTDDSKRLIKECLRLMKKDEKTLSPKELLCEISSAKDKLISPKEYRADAGDDYRLKTYAQVYELYQDTLKKANAMDFDDIIFNAIKLLEKDEEVRSYYQNKFRFIHVDEYQDTNHAQYVLTSLLADKYKNICVVGDDDQSIYAFRGANIRNILDFEKDYPGAVVIRLEQNYRSTSTILNAANAVISNNLQRKGKNLWTDNGDGKKITVASCDNESGEAKYITETINNNIRSGRSYKDHVILYRMNVQSNALEYALMKSAVPYRIIGGHRFYERMEIKDAIAYLSVINNPDDNVRLRRIVNVPKRGIGDTALNAAASTAALNNISMYEAMKNAEDFPELYKYSKKYGEFISIIEELSIRLDKEPIAELFEDIMVKSGYRDELFLMLHDESKDAIKIRERLEGLDEFKSSMVRFSEENPDGKLSDFLEELSLLTDIDNFNAQEDCVTLMTLHSAKGLEFPVVFIAGLEEGIFPSRISIYESNQVEEERRLFYVGITRAKEELFISYAKLRVIFGSPSYNRPSRFLTEIPPELCNNVSTGFESTAKNAFTHRESKPQTGFGTSRRLGGKSAGKQPTETYAVGDKVLHSAFGEGIITAVKPIANDNLLEIDFNGVTKKVMANYAKLEKQ